MINTYYREDKPFKKTRRIGNKKVTVTHPEKDGEKYLLHIDGKKHEKAFKNAIEAFNFSKSLILNN